MTSTSFSTGIVLGKFMPPHAGHMHLIDFARHYVSRLAIVMDSLPKQPIPAELRLKWLRELFPAAEVYHMTGMPQAPEEHPDFWALWERGLRLTLPFQPDFVFASEAYGAKVAEVLGARFIPVDCARSAVPISGTMIRQDPLRHWGYIPRCVRPYFVKRICLFGPESTGKSTLAQQLSEHFGTVVVPEFARTYLELRHGQIELSDMELIARGQAANEDALALQANRLLFCDTDLLTTMIWSKRLFHECSAWIEAAANQRQYDLYLVTDVDVPWVNDNVRYLPNDRQPFLAQCIQELEIRSRRYVRVSGDSAQRFGEGIKAVDFLLADSAKP